MSWPVTRSATLPRRCQLSCLFPSCRRRLRVTLDRHTPAWRRTHSRTYNALFVPEVVLFVPNHRMGPSDGQLRLGVHMARSYLVDMTKYGVIMRILCLVVV